MDVQKSGFYNISPKFYPIILIILLFPLYIKRKSNYL